MDIVPQQINALDASKFLPCSPRISSLEKIYGEQGRNKSGTRRKFIANKEEIFAEQRAIFEMGGSKKNRVI